MDLLGIQTPCGWPSMSNRALPRCIEEAWDRQDDDDERFETLVEAVKVPPSASTTPDNVHSRENHKALLPFHLRPRIATERHSHPVASTTDPGGTSASSSSARDTILDSDRDDSHWSPASSYCSAAENLNPQDVISSVTERFPEHEYDSEDWYTASSLTSDGDPHPIPDPEPEDEATTGSLWLIPLETITGPEIETDTSEWSVYTSSAGGNLTEWYTELADVKSFQEKLYIPFQEDVLELLGNINCQVLSIERGCERKLILHGRHIVYFFTNHRISQVYCAHTSSESKEIDLLLLRHQRYSTELEAIEDPTPIPYEKFMQDAFSKTKKYLILETVFPADGIDMEALSPRDVNARVKKQQSDRKGKVVEKLAAGRQIQREKDHPPPPPAQVIEPPSSDRENGAIYTTGELLGRGGFAICYEGTLSTEKTKKKFALKIVKTQMPQKKMEQKFQTELQIHSKMKHPNIVQFHRAFTFQESTYIVLELCPNGSLMDMIKKRSYVTEPEVRFYTIQMAGAIKYMHAKGIIHRDLKMGNIFLDRDMNVKIGDFGLAALLMSGKDMSACRRTTLCGTPNYIAPEILEKGKKGHDHAVDIWSLGIIIFALLTGKPPFQSTTQDEIYRKAREREYDWPQLSASDNYIGQEAKDLVANLLQKAEERPDPDTIVQHKFFSSGWVPQEDEMSPRFREEAPSPNDFLSVGLRAGRSILYERNLKKLCIKSAVGPFGSALKISHSTYKEVAAEEKAGLTPIVPLVGGVVYRPFDEMLKEHEIATKREAAEAATMESHLRPRHTEQSQISLSSSRTQVVVPIRSAPQSHAAQLRAQNQLPVSTAVANSTKKALQSSDTAPKMKASSSKEVTSKSRANTVSRQRQAKDVNSETRIKEPQPNSITSSETIQARIGADLVEQLNQTQAERKSQETPRIRDASENRVSIFNPRERPELLLQTRPFHVLTSLQRLNAELERALNSRSVGPHRADRPKPTPTIVVKWVDYTNKFGLGYILSNGSVGCVFRSSVSSRSSKGQIPPTCVVVRDAEKHLQCRARTGYPDRAQLIPMNGSPVEFYESGEYGISKVEVAPETFKVAAGGNGEQGKLARGKDEWDDRKREKMVIWNKFANYMTAYGRDQDYPYDDTLQRVPVESQVGADGSGNVVTFYQRFGDVGCWAFGDGHFQFNFPDHTKIVLSSDGLWCDFYHLPLEAARDLATTGALAPSALDDRQHLCYPLQTLLNFSEKPSRNGKISSRFKDHDISPIIQGIPRANDFRRKVEFIKTVFNEWVQNGGLGNSDMTPEGRLRWLGHRELISVKIPYKHVWVTVGARDRDDRRVAWFDPKKPEDIIPDIEA